MGRRLALFLAACLVVPALALAAEGDPTKRITPADQKKAAAIVLKRADLSAGWKRLPTRDRGAKLRCPGYHPNESDLTLTGESSSEFSTTDGRFIASTSSVYGSAKDALASWTRNVKPALVQCLAYSLRQDVIAAGGKATIVKQGRIAFPRVAPRTVAIRVEARVTFTDAGKSVTRPFTMQVVGVGRGRGDANMVAMSPGAGMPAGALLTIARLLASRLSSSRL